MTHVSYLINRPPSTSIDLQITQEIWRGESGLFNLTDFRLLAYSLVNSQKRNKLESKSKKCIFIRFTKRVKVHQRSRGCRLWDPETRSAFTSRDVIFDEESMLQEKSETKDKAQGGASDSSADTQKKGVEFSESPKRPDGSDEDSLDSDRDEHEAT